MYIGYLMDEHTYYEKCVTYIPEFSSIKIENIQGKVFSSPLHTEL